VFFVVLHSSLNSNPSNVVEESNPKNFFSVAPLVRESILYSKNFLWMP